MSEELYQTFRHWLVSREKNGPALFEAKVQKPDYSFDRWLKMAKDLGDDVNSMVTQGKDSEKALDHKEKDQKAQKNKKVVPPQDEEDDEAEKKKKESAWNTLKKIHQERQEDGKKKPLKKK